MPDSDVTLRFAGDAAIGLVAFDACFGDIQIFPNKQNSRQSTISQCRFPL